MVVSRGITRWVLLRVSSFLIFTGTAEYVFYRSEASCHPADFLTNSKDEDKAHVYIEEDPQQNIENVFRVLPHCKAEVDYDDDQNGGGPLFSESGSCCNPDAVHLMRSMVHTMVQFKLRLVSDTEKWVQDTEGVITQTEAFVQRKYESAKDEFSRISDDDGNPLPSALQGVGNSQEKFNNLLYRIAELQQDLSTTRCHNGRFGLMRTRIFAVRQAAQILQNGLGVVKKLVNMLMCRRCFATNRQVNGIVNNDSNAEKGVVKRIEPQRLGLQAVPLDPDDLKKGLDRLKERWNEESDLRNEPSGFQHAPLNSPQELLNPRDVFPFVNSFPIRELNELVRSIFGNQSIVQELETSILALRGLGEWIKDQDAKLVEWMGPEGCLTGYSLALSEGTWFNSLPGMIGDESESEASVIDHHDADLALKAIFFKLINLFLTYDFSPPTTYTGGRKTEFISRLQTWINRWGYILSGMNQKLMHQLEVFARMNDRELNSEGKAFLNFPVRDMIVDFRSEWKKAFVEGNENVKGVDKTFTVKEGAVQKNPSSKAKKNGKRKMLSKAEVCGWLFTPSNVEERNNKKKQQNRIGALQKSLLLTASNRRRFSLYLLDLLNKISTRLRFKIVTFDPIPIHNSLVHKIFAQTTGLGMCHYIVGKLVNFAASHGIYSTFDGPENIAQAGAENNAAVTSGNPVSDNCAQKTREFNSLSLSYIIDANLITSADFIQAVEEIDLQSLEVSILIPDIDTSNYIFRNLLSGQQFQSTVGLLGYGSGRNPESNSRFLQQKSAIVKKSMRTMTGVNNGFNKGLVIVIRISEYNDLEETEILAHQISKYNEGFVLSGLLKFVLLEDWVEPKPKHNHFPIHVGNLIADPMRRYSLNPDRDEVEIDNVDAAAIPVIDMPKHVKVMPSPGSSCDKGGSGCNPEAQATETTTTTPAIPEVDSPLKVAMREPKGESWFNRWKVDLQDPNNEVWTESMFIRKNETQPILHAYWRKHHATRSPKDVSASIVKELGRNRGWYCDYAVRKLRDDPGAEEKREDSDAEQDGKYNPGSDPAPDPTQFDGRHVSMSDQAWFKEQHDTAKHRRPRTLDDIVLHMMDMANHASVESIKDALPSFCEWIRVDEELSKRPYDVIAGKVGATDLPELESENPEEGIERDTGKGSLGYFGFPDSVLADEDGNNAKGKKEIELSGSESEKQSENIRTIQNSLIQYDMAFSADAKFDLVHEGLVKLWKPKFRNALWESKEEQKNALRRRDSGSMSLASTGNKGKIVYVCHPHDLCGGHGDRTNGMMNVFLLGLLLDRDVYFDNDNPVPIHMLFRPKQIDWRVAHAGLSQIGGGSYLWQLDGRFWQDIDVLLDDLSETISITCNLREFGQFLHHPKLVRKAQMLGLIGVPHLVRHIWKFLFENSFYLENQLRSARDTLKIGVYNAYSGTTADESVSSVDAKALTNKQKQPNYPPKKLPEPEDNCIFPSCQPTLVVREEAADLSTEDRLLRERCRDMHSENVNNRDCRLSQEERDDPSRNPQERDEVLDYQPYIGIHFRAGNESAWWDPSRHAIDEIDQFFACAEQVEREMFTTGMVSEVVKKKSSGSGSAALSAGPDKPFSPSPVISIPWFLSSDTDRILKLDSVQTFLKSGKLKFLHEKKEGEEESAIVHIDRSKASKRLNGIIPAYVGYRLLSGASGIVLSRSWFGETAAEIGVSSQNAYFAGDGSCTRVELSTA